jgi:hypothetical protein
MHSTGSPKRLSSVHSHVAVGPVSRPIRTAPDAFDLTKAAIASGSESTTPSCTIDPARFTTQIDVCDPETASRAVKEYLATLDDAAFGAASDKVPKFVSPPDPAAQWTGVMKGAAFFAYPDNYLIDVKCGVIMGVKASRAIRQAEVGALQTMIERAFERQCNCIKAATPNEAGRRQPSQKVAVGVALK